MNSEQASSLFRRLAQVASLSIKKGDTWGGMVKAEPFMSALGDDDFEVGLIVTHRSLSKPEMISFTEESDLNNIDGIVNAYVNGAKAREQAARIAREKAEQEERERLTKLTRGKVVQSIKQDDGDFFSTCECITIRFEDGSRVELSCSGVVEWEHHESN